MTDLDDIVEGTFEPESLLLTLAAVYNIILIFITVMLLPPVAESVITLALTGLGFVNMVLCIVAFLQLSTDSPSYVQEHIKYVMNEAEEEKSQYENMREKEAVKNLKSKYVNGEISEEELDKALDDTIGNNDAEQVIRQHN